METENPTTLEQVTEAHRELMRLERRTAGDWARDGWTLPMAQAAVNKARADYAAVFTAYAKALPAPTRETDSGAGNNPNHPAWEARY